MPLRHLLVHVYTCQPVVLYISKLEYVDLSLFIDDWLLLIQAATKAAVINRMVKAAAALLHLIEVELGCTVATRMSAVIASCDDLRYGVAKAMGKYAGKAVRGASNLGVAAFAGQLRCKAGCRLTLQEKAANLKRRKRRLAAVRRGGADMEKLYVSGLQAYGYCGAEVVRLDSGELARAQGTFLSTVGSVCPSRSKTMSLMLHNDPTWSLVLGPAITWGSLVWRATANPLVHSLAELNRLATPILQHPPGTWKQVRGPLGAATLSLQRYSWHLISAFVLCTDLGDEIHLTGTPLSSKQTCRQRR